MCNGRFGMFPADYVGLQETSSSSSAPQLEGSKRDLSTDTATVPDRVPDEKQALRTLPPVFYVTDYGKVVECIRSYVATESRQLSMRVGDKAVLLKNGVRGWVLLQTEDRSKQGWFLAHFLRLSDIDVASDIQA